MTAQGEWIKGVWFPANPLKVAEITVNAKNYAELTKLQAKVKSWKDSIKRKRAIERRIRSLAQKRGKIEEEIEGHIGTLFGAV